MYGKKILDILKKKKIEIGDEIKIYYKDTKKEFRGILLPKQLGSDPNCIVLKLSSGYNIGLDISGAIIEKISSSAVVREVEKKGLKKEELQQEYKNSFVLVGAGGTISSKVDYLTGAVDSKLNPQEIVELYPELKRFEPLKAKNVFNLLSENISQPEWEELAKEIKNIFDDGANAVVVLHGTDTLCYTAAALNYALEGLAKPLILCGSQRSSDRPSSDARQNLFCSLLAAEKKIAGVYVCMHATYSDDFNYLHLATRVRKSHSSGRWAFRSIGLRPVAKIYFKEKQVELNPEFVLPKFEEKQKIILKNKFSQAVHLAWAYPGLKPEEIKHWAKYDGVVIAGTGLGHLPIYSHQQELHKKVISELKELIASGVVLVMASQTLEGRVMLQTYSTGRILQDIGIIGNGCDWLVETAFVKLCWALGQSKDPKKVKELMLKPINYDINPYSSLEALEQEE
ncbi:MAG: Glu-tRNA(Gln) amidotransferase subunit GatD [Candidatus Micrarchaeota archaeon]|nr:Glu-tRNA(Gln) amidotransferase subunit GatD [Candidatus Micrarchaeota archaeon]